MIWGLAPTMVNSLIIFYRLQQSFIGKAKIGMTSDDQVVKYLYLQKMSGGLQLFRQNFIGVAGLHIP